MSMNVLLRTRLFTLIAGWAWCLMLCHAPLLAQPMTAIHQDHALTVWEADDDLPNNDVYSMVSDGRGFLWVGTASGLVRFDGRNFIRPHGVDEAFFQASTTYSVVESAPGEVVFVHDQDATNRLMVMRDGQIREHPANLQFAPGQRVFAVFRESDGVLWILFNNRDWMRWSSSGAELFPAEQVLSPYHPSSVVVAKNGWVFLARGAGVEIYSQGRLSTLQGVEKGPAAMAASADGGVWIAQGKRLFRWHDGGLERLEVPPSAEAMWPPHLMLETRDQGLWLAFRDAGLYRSYDAGVVQVSTSHRILRCLHEDREGNLWIGTAGGGLNRIRRSSFAVWAVEVPDTIGSICEDKEGQLWLGNARGVWQLRDGRAVAPGVAADWPSFAHSICPDQEGALWIGGPRDVFRYRPGQDAHPMPMPPGPVHHAYAIHCTRDGSVWVGCESGPLLRYNKDGVSTFGKDQGYDGSFAQVFGEDSTGTLWVGTRRGELFRFSEGTFHAIPTPLLETATGILTITPGKDGALWLGTRGLGFMHLKQNEVRFVGTSAGLPDGLISQVLTDEDGNFWVGSSNSIFFVNAADLEACADGRSTSLQPLRFGRADGISGFFATGQRQPCAWKGRDGRMWFVGRKGVVTLHPSQRKNDASHPEIFIDEVKSDATLLEPEGSIPSDNRRLEFRFASPTFIAPDAVRFRFRLLGFESAWTEAGGQGLAVYPRLQAGDYTFEVSASNRQKIWNPEPARHHFTVTPVWWEWWWLRALMVLAIAAAAMWVARGWLNRRLVRRMLALEQERKVELERSRIARDLHDGIGSGLTQLGWLAGDMEDEAAATPDLKNQSQVLGSRIRELARDLDAAVWAVSPRHDTLASLCAYFCEFALEHFRRTPIRCRVNAPESLPSGNLAPHLRNHLFMATREALNNALKHSGATEVHLDISLENQSLLEIRITDNGHGFDLAAARLGIRQGLGNLEERLTEIHGRVEITSSPQGTCVRLIAPLDA